MTEVTTAQSRTQIKEHDVVVLTAPVLYEDLPENVLGTVVHVYDNLRACEVEFVTTEGSKVVTVPIDQVRRYR